MLFKHIIYFIFLFLSSLHAKEDVVKKHKIFIETEGSFNKAAIEDILSVEHQSIFSVGKEDAPLIQDKLIPTLEVTLKSFYDSEGFYNAQFDIKQNAQSIHIKIEENKPIRVADINLSSDYNLTQLLTFKKGAIFRAKEFIEVKNSIMRSLINKGYCSYDLDTKAYVDLKKHRVDLRYILKKGDFCTFGDTYVTGLKSIDTHIVKSKVMAKKGERFDPKKLKESYNKVYGLDAFDSVIINTNRKFYNEVPIDMTLIELNKPYHYEIGAGYDTFLGARVHGKITKRNFLGNAQKITLKASWSQKEQLLELDFFKPSLLTLFEYSLDFGSKVGYSNLEYTGFQEKKAFLDTYLEYSEKKFKFKMGLALENIEIALLDNFKTKEDLEQAVKEGTFVLFYPYLNMVYDARDDKLNPKFGYYLSGYVEYGLPYKADASSYLKMLLEGRLIHTFGDLTLASVGKLGVIDQSSHDIPESKRFFAGGSYYNRAYGYNKLGVILSPTTDSIQGASTLLNLSLEADYPIWGDLYGAVFTDNTMLNEKSYDFEGDVITSAGVGVRYMTPIGPFKLDVGLNVHDTSQYGISFQIGQSF